MQPMKYIFDFLIVTEIYLPVQLFFAKMIARDFDPIPQKSKFSQ